MVGEDYATHNELRAGGDFKGMNEGEAPASRGMKADYWNPRWIPFATSGGGDYLCVDMDPAPEGKAGQVISMLRGNVRGRKVLAPSLEAFLEQLVARIESGDLLLHVGQARCTLAASRRVRARSRRCPFRW